MGINVLHNSSLLLYGFFSSGNVSLQTVYYFICFSYYCAHATLWPVYLSLTKLALYRIFTRGSISLFDYPPKFEVAHTLFFLAPKIRIILLNRIPSVRTCTSSCSKITVHNIQLGRHIGNQFPIWRPSDVSVLNI